MDLAAFSAALPKVELHLHLEGTLEPELKLELARRNGVDLGQTTVEEVRATYAFDSLASFLAVYYPAMDVLVTRADFRDLAMAYFTKAAQQNVRHAEVFFDPQVHVARGVAFEDVVLGYHDAVVDAEREFGMSAGLILCLVRDLPLASAEAVVEQMLEFGDRIVGIGLDSDERGHPPADFAHLFARARAAGFKVTAHCDVDQEDTVEHLRQVIEDIEVDRIDHGTNVVEDPRLLELVRRRGLGLTCCPISNSFVTSDSKAPVIADLLRRGVRVTVNSDDPAYFGGYVTENLVHLTRAADLTPDELIQLQRNAIEVSWASAEVKEGFLAELDAFEALVAPSL
ncbi:adenosine deaminase [Kineococcus rhizosphaerae]|uniref:Adenine deaminase n=1 Tax=Kineococcus rhizosphaerae TaxID=559628 RepID=A0A2T0QXQ7_9ACTN|nr:adenosine deaminase [Kineococcus rhizosphaerae]PRY10826.1 adenosine deaminase [Kineococcus rhizosphaerae]